MRSVVLSTLLALVACSSDKQAGDDTGDPATVGDDTAADVGGGVEGGGEEGGGTEGGGEEGGDEGGGTGVPDLEDGWTEFNPGGDTICSRGTDFAFWVAKGSVNKVVIDFFGGGACWDEASCGFADALFEDDVDWIRDLDKDNLPGLYDREDPDNPFKDWYHVVVPYCTGDIHWGDNSATYGEGDDAFTIEHKGAVNGAAVLDWVSESFSAPEDIFVTGCSAGAYGSIGWTPHVAERFPDARITQFGDSGQGVVTADWFAESFPNWNAEATLPHWIPGFEEGTIDYATADLVWMYTGFADYYPNVMFSQYNTRRDSTQVFYYQAMGGGSADEWEAIVYEDINAIEAAVPNYRSFLADGTQHCILTESNFNEMEAGEVRLVDWLGALVEREEPDSVRCEDCTGG